MYHYIKFAADPMDTAEELKRIILFTERADPQKIVGWIRRSDKGIHGMLIVLERNTGAAQNLVKNIIGSNTEFYLIRKLNYKYQQKYFSRMRMIVDIKDNNKWNNSNVVFINGVDQHGLLKGWAYTLSLSEKPKIVTYVDKIRVGECIADEFREDLLKVGIGDGEHSFSLLLPEEILDGKQHKIYVEVMSNDGECMLRSKVIDLLLPKRLQVEAKWRGDRKTTIIHTIRQGIVQEGLKKWLNKLSREWDDHPDKIFCDAGIAERYKREGRNFLSFRERLSHRLASKSCPHIIRKLNSKIFTKDFCSTRSILVPKTLLISKDIHKISEYPYPTRFVLKPTLGSGKATYLYDSGYDLAKRIRVSVEDILKDVKRFKKANPESEFIIEEFIEQINTGFGCIPVDYKFHVFGGKVRIIHVLDRNVSHLSQNSYRHYGWFSKDWEPSPFPFRRYEHESVDFLPPVQLSEMIKIAEMVGGECGDYVRVDLYDGAKGVVLGEVTIFSNAGMNFTEYGDRILSQAWHVSVLLGQNDSFLEWTEPDSRKI